MIQPSIYNLGLGGSYATWLYKGVTEWFITSSTFGENIVYVFLEYGFIYDNSSEPPISGPPDARPTTYLKPEVSICGGTRAYTDPYILTM